MPKGPTPTFTSRRQVFLEPATDDAVRAVAERSGMSMSQVIREAVKLYVPTMETGNGKGHNS